MRHARMSQQTWRASTVIASPDLHHQAARFLIAGGFVSAVYIGLTLLLSGPLDVPIQIAIPISFVTAVALHYACQRFFVFRHVSQFALSARSQIGRYVVIGSVQYAVTAGSTGVLPGVVGASEQVVYVCTVVVISALTFVLLRTRVFHDSPR
jgi:putative flippase GtrA